MPDPTESFKININQNMWGLIVSFTSLGMAEYYHLRTLFWLSIITTIIMILSVGFTTLSYTKNYVVKKQS